MVVNMKLISSHQSPESPQPSPPPGQAHIDEIEKPEGEEITPQPAPREGWTVIAEEEIIQPDPHLAGEIVLLVSVIADNSLCDLLTNFVPDCFSSLSHQSIFKSEQSSENAQLHLASRRGHRASRSEPLSAPASETRRIEVSFLAVRAYRADPT
jgi:hypothetical protein